MVLCKYFQQGNCRFGQYCRFDHINNFGNSASRNKTYPDNKNIALIVAEEVLTAERGGQWLLSCFGPFAEQPCISGMEDLSAEEVRWEMYQAQKNGTADQTKLQFQQLCQDMKSKRDVLKNPTQEIASMLEKLQKGGQSAGFGSNPLAKSTNFSFATPQLGSPTSSASTSSPFGNKPFGTSANPFGGSFGTSATTPFLYGRTTTNNATPLFGLKPTFSNNLVFANTNNANTLFGNANKSPTSIFGGAQNAQTFGSAVMPQNNSIFGGASTQPVFGQPVTFGTSTQATSPFSRTQSGQYTTSAFGSGTTSTPSLFGGTTTPQSTTSLFGATQTTPSSLFNNTTTSQVTNPIFGLATSVAGSPMGSASLFSQPKGAASAFGGAPVFSGAPSFASNPAGTIFGGQSNFGSPPVSSSNIFGGSSTATPTFGSVNQSTNMTFESVAVSPANIFGGSQANSAPFGSAVSTSSITSFAPSTSTTSTPFVTANSGPFGSTGATPTPFSRSAPFESAASGKDSTATFGTNVTSFGGPFGVATSMPNFGSANAAPSTFGTSPFRSTANSSFTPTDTAVTATTSNSFTAKLQQSNSPLVSGPVQTKSTIFATEPFGKSPFASVAASAIIDETIYTIEGQLTDDEKSIYLSKQFVLGKIPRKPPTISLR